MVHALLRLLLENVIQSIEEHRGVLPVVPDRQQRQDRGVGQRHERVEGHQTADRQGSRQDLTGADPEKENRCQQRDRLNGAEIPHHGEISLEETPSHPQELIEHQVSKRAFGGHGLHRLDPLDRVDLVGVVLAERVLDGVEDRAKPAGREKHQESVERSGREEHQGQCPAVKEHQREARGQLRPGGHTRDAALNEELAHLADPFEPALNVPRAAGREVRHRQSQESACQEVEGGGVDTHGH